MPESSWPEAYANAPISEQIGTLLLFVLGCALLAAVVATLAALPFYVIWKIVSVISRLKSWKDVVGVFQTMLGLFVIWIVIVRLG